MTEHEKLLRRTFKGKTCLVTGGAGFIGSHLVERLAELGANVIIYDNLMRGKHSIRNLNEIYQRFPTPRLVVGDILDFERLKPLVNESDFIFHLAALPSHRLALERPRDYALIDLIGTVNILEAMRLSKKRKQKMVFASSNKVYGKQKTPWREDMPYAPEGPYAQAKVSAEEFCKQYHKYYGIKTIIIRYHHVIGTRTNPELALAIFTERVLQGKPPIIHGHFEKGKFTPCAADFTNIADAVNGTLIATAKVKDLDIFNIAKPKLTTVLELAELVIKYLNSKVKPRFIEMLPHETLLHHSDVSKAKKVLGFEAKIPAEVSVKQYVEWRLSYGKNF